MTGMSVLFFFNGIFNPIFRQHRIFFHFLFFVVLESILFCQTQIQPEMWTNTALNQLIPTGHHLILLGPGENIVVDTEFAVFIRAVFAHMEYTTVLTTTKLVLFNICVNGLNIWTLSAFAVTFFGILTPSFFMGQNVMGLGFGALKLIGLVIITAGVAVLMERIQRQKFLAERLLSHQMHVAVTADGILNHMLKNTLADAAGCIELFLAGAASFQALNDSVHCLRRGMKACKQRQVYLKMVSGEYVAVQNTVNLKELGSSLWLGVGCGGSSSISRSYWTVRC
eukprot:TRINITY_DN1295_c0_g1_i1.p1 TRINITY_DN1295_c0_g1~~TRINITY_DN1295_c0_g1_i1.p1  ORF type:complete len:312 (-),score=39.45 TRINITY_DN1295_c0_g1_i1:229-1074(-)